MPTCRTCRGEYDRQKVLCPACRKPIGCSQEVCPRCNTKIGEKRLCPRCQSDVSVWECEYLRALKFFLKSGVLGLLPGLLSFVVWLVLFRRTGSRYYYPLLTAVSLGLSLLVFIGAYASRLFWWDQWWQSQVYNTKSVSIAGTMGGAGLAGVCFTALWVLLYAAWGKPEGLWRQAFFGMSYVLSYVCFTAAVTLFLVYLYLAYFEQHAPQPLFVDTTRLVRLVVDAAIQNINPPDASAALAAASQAPTYETQQMLRRPADGGIVLVLREGKFVQAYDANGQARQAWETKLWRVKADRWGRVQAIDPLPPET